MTYLTGDATQPVGADPKILVHVCNDRGRWGKEFVVAISQRWKEPEAAFRPWYSEGGAKSGVPPVRSRCQEPERVAEFALSEVSPLPVVRRPLPSLAFGHRAASR